jgi:hypothetical protein
MWRHPGSGYSTLFISLLAGCGVSVPTPPLTAHQTASFIEVPYPPPAALAETIPPPPNDEAVWVDGAWTFRGNSYVWERGGWVLVPTGASYAIWRFVFTRDARLMFAPGTWYDAQGRELESPEALVPARTPSNEFTPESATGS